MHVAANSVPGPDANPAGKIRGGGRENQGPPEHAVAHGYRRKFESTGEGAAPTTANVEDSLDLTADATTGEDAVVGQGTATSADSVQEQTDPADKELDETNSSAVSDDPPVAEEHTPVIVHQTSYFVSIALELFESSHTIFGAAPNESPTDGTVSTEVDLRA